MKKQALTRLLTPTMSLLLGICALILVAGIVTSPAPAFQASLRGISLWWHVVFPALLPFLVLSEILTAYGWVHGVGALLEPLMKKVFGLPGIGGWALTMGMTAGFPGGAGATLQLHERGMISGKDAGKLAALSHFCNPITILIVIATGLMHQPSIGYAIIGIHWLTGVIAYLTVYPVRRKNNKGGDTEQEYTVLDAGESLPRRIVRSAKDAHIRDGRSFGRLLGDSVTQSVQSLMMIGGYIIIFAVIIQIISRFMPPGLSSYWLSGVFEVHLGVNNVSDTSFPSNRLEWAIISALLGFSGFSAMLQSMSLLKGAGVRWLPFIMVRTLHAVYSFGLTWIIWPPLDRLMKRITPAFAEPEFSRSAIRQIWSLWTEIPVMIKWQGAVLCCLVVLSLGVVLFSPRSSR